MRNNVERGGGPVRAEVRDFWKLIAPWSAGVFQVLFPLDFRQTLAYHPCWRREGEKNVKRIFLPVLFFHHVNYWRKWTSYCYLGDHERFAEDGDLDCSYCQSGVGKMKETCWKRTTTHRLVAGSSQWRELWRHRYISRDHGNTWSEAHCNKFTAWQSVNTINQWIEPFMNSLTINQSINQSMDTSINQSINQSKGRTTKWTNQTSLLHFFFNPEKNQSIYKIENFLVGVFNEQNSSKLKEDLP